MERRLTRRSAIVGGLGLATTGAVRAVEDASPTPTPAVADVPMFRGNPARTGQHPGPGPNAPLYAMWATRLGTAVSATPVLHDGTLFVGSVNSATLSGGALHAVDARTGEELWRIQTEMGDAFFASPAVADRTVFAASYDGIVLAASADSGAERWRFQAEASVFSSPVVWQGAVCFGDVSGVSYCLDAETGAERWRFGPDEPFRRSSNASPSVTGTTIFVVHSAQYADEDSILFALDVTSGQERWRYVAAEGDRVRSATCIANGHVHAVTVGGVVAALTVDDGTEVWRYDAAGEVRTLPALGETALYLITGPAPHHLHIVDPTTGTPRAVVAVGGEGDILASPTVAQQIVYFGDKDGRLYAVDGVSGFEHWHAGVGSLISTPVVANGAVYIGSEAGELRAVGGSLKPELPAR